MRIRSAILVFIISTILCTANLGGWGLWSPDEPRYAEVAREMVITNNYIVPHLNGKTYTRKPPLLFWMSALSYKIFGINEWSARLPVAITGIAVIMLTMFMGYKLFDLQTGIWSGLILSTTFWFIWQARRVKMDVPVTLFIVIAIFALYSGLEERNRKRRLAYYFTGFLSIGFGALCKGPVALSIPGLTLAAYCLHTKNLSVLKEKEFWITLPLPFVVYSIWLTAAVFKLGYGYALDQIYYKTSRLFLHTKVHRHGPLFYLYHYLIDTFPWSLFLVPSILSGFSTYKGKERKCFILLFWWFVANFTFFSLAATKRSSYLIPLYPSASILISSYIVRETPIRLYRLIFALTTLLGIFSVIGSVIFIKVATTPFIIGGILLLILGIVPLYKSIQIKINHKVWLTFTLFVFTLYSFYFAIPSFDKCKCVKELCRKAVQISSVQGCPIYLYGIGNSHAGEFNFYTRIVPLPIVKRGENNIRNLLNQKARVLIITKGRYFNQLKKTYKLKAIFQQPCGHRFTLFSNEDFKGAGE